MIRNPLRRGGSHRVRVSAPGPLIGHFGAESAVILGRKPRSLSTGKAGHFEPETSVRLDRNMHQVRIEMRGHALSGVLRNDPCSNSRTTESSQGACWPRADSSICLLCGDALPFDCGFLIILFTYLICLSLLEI